MVLLEGLEQHRARPLLPPEHLQLLGRIWVERDLSEEIPVAVATYGSGLWEAFALGGQEATISIECGDRTADRGLQPAALAGIREGCQPTGHATQAGGHIRQLMQRDIDKRSAHVGEVGLPDG